MVEALRGLLDLDAPTTTHVQRWTFAKPVGQRDDACFLGDAGVGLCGDGWGASKVEAAYLSGLRAGGAPARAVSSARARRGWLVMTASTPSASRYSMSAGVSAV